jgi:hypothetical protein
MGERLTVKKFDSLKPTDFKNGAILDDIRFSLRRLEELEQLHDEKEEIPRPQDWPPIKIPHKRKKLKVVLEAMPDEWEGKP